MIQQSILTGGVKVGGILSCAKLLRFLEVCELKLTVASIFAFCPIPTVKIKGPQGLFGLWERKSWEFHQILN
jgi:hypothetical protein